MLHRGQWCFDFTHYATELAELERQQNEDAQRPPHSTDGAAAAADQNLQSNEVSQSDNMLKAAKGSQQENDQLIPVGPVTRRQMGHSESDHADMCRSSLMLLLLALRIASILCFNCLKFDTSSTLFSAFSTFTCLVF